MRLDKYICESTELTRSEAKKWLKQGDITVDDKVVKSGNFKVPEGAVVAYDGQVLELRKTRYIMLNKPKEFISSNVDEVYPSLLHLIDLDKAFDLHIAGRLDADTTGLVLLTDDGKWSHNITSPKKGCKKRYRVELADPVEDDYEQQLTEGVMLNGETEPTKPAALKVINEHEVLLTISEGKYHQVKRMFAALGNKVDELHRESIGGITLDEELAFGEWRYLTEAEINSI